ncbi:hypothetical protein [Vibrio marisflavi]|nr:hypothetical protein [Vibrio marisflavi]
MEDKKRLVVGDHVRPQSDLFGLLLDNMPIMDVMFVDHDNGVAECQYYDQYQQKHSHILLISILEKVPQK